MRLKTEDTISRQATIEAIEEAYCKPCKERGDDYNEVRCRACDFDCAIIQIDGVPPVEPERPRVEWVPVSEPPKENGDYIVSLEDSVYPWGRFFNGKWFMLSTDGIAREFGKHEVIAWQPLPKPYKENEE